MLVFVIFALAGAVAQLVDGSLGMGYGVTATTVLLAAGTAPATASASVHFAKVGTGLASGAAHWKFGNVDWPVVTWIALPGAVGAVVGAVVLSSLPVATASPWVAALLVLLGAYVLVRFSFRAVAATVVGSVRPGKSLLAPLGLTAGFIDSIGGGGWGPVATSSLLASGRLEPRKVVGSVSTAEFVVAVAASVGFLFALAGHGISWVTVAGLLVGGVVAAPFAAWLVRAMPARLLGTAAGGLIVLTNVHTLLEAVGVTGTGMIVVHLLLAAIWVAALVAAVRSVRADRAEVEALTDADDAVSNSPTAGDGDPVGR
ncbi:MAG: TSUP family transporter [Pseudonocardiaceae bacterium]|nr:TSUP family transporter [Pseudonocardiaceae bacterium]